jgi:polar amino acid transport system ATP-binding protein
MTTLAPTPHPPSTRGLVEIRNVTKSYGGVEVLRDVTLTITPGEVVTILGPSGSGKSTLLRTINHLEAVDSGWVSIDGTLIGYDHRGGKLHELRERHVLRRRTQVGMVFQNFNLFPHLTAVQNIVAAPVSLRRLSKSDAHELAVGLLETVGLADKADAYPRQLSGGQQQRVAIARALALQPKVLLFDEPTSALDPELVGEVLDVIRDLAELGTTLVIVTHEIGFAREVSDRVVFIDNGVVLEVGPPAEVLDSPRHPRAREFLATVL